MPVSAAQEAEALPPIGAKLPSSRPNVAILVMIGIFVTTFAQDKVFANYPIRQLLRTTGCDATQIANFGVIAALAWYLKPFIGVLTDCFPLFGSRRKAYLLIGAIGGSVMWGSLAFIPYSYNTYMWVIVGVNFALVIASATAGGLLVEEGQRCGATGGLSSMRYVVMNGASLIAAPVGALLVVNALHPKFSLVERSFHSTAWAGAAFCAALALATVLLMRNEPVSPGLNREALNNAGRQLRTVFTTPVLWLAAVFTFLVSFAPGFSTPLYLYQTNTLHFTDSFISSHLQLIGSIGGIAGSAFYGLLCRRISLLWMIIVSTVTCGFSALGYLHYHNAQEAYVVEPIYNFFNSMAQVMTLDVAAQAAPKGSEAMSYGILLSAYNLASQFADKVGSMIIDKFHYHGDILGHAVNIVHVTFPQLVWINSLTTFLTLLAVPLLPRIMLRRRDGSSPEQSDFIQSPNASARPTSSGI